MLMKDKAKSMVSLIVNKAKGPNHMDNLKPEMVESPEMKDGVQQDASVPQNAAAEELISAIEAKSPAGIVEAMKALMQILDSEEDSKEEE
jgi:uncharacterized protein (UPF0147 family)